MNATKIQQALVDLGYQIAVDGIIGTETSRAIRDLQTKYFVTGTADKRTIDLLKELTKIKPTDTKPIADLAIQIPLQSNEYIHEKTEKQAITLHLTAGSGSPHFTRDTWELDSYLNQYAIATHFIISGEFSFPPNPAFNTQDGGIYQTFPLDFWAYHVNFQKACNANNIGIEICNRGPVLKRDNRYFIAGTSIELAESEVEAIEFRGCRFWHRLTDAQIEGLKKLLLGLLKQYPAIAQTVKNQTFDNRWGDYRAECEAGRQGGIVCHTNFMKEELRLRFDMPPFPRLMNMLNSLKVAAPSAV